MKKTIATLLMLLLAASLAFSQTPHKSGIKCAVVKTVTENRGGVKSYNTLWFDDYGAKEKNLTTMDMGAGMGVAEWKSVSVGDKTYNFDDSRKKVTTMDRIDLNYLDTENAVAKARKMTVLGNETVGGRPCVKIQEKVKQLLHTATVTSWVWQGIPIKYDIDNPESHTTLIEIVQQKSLPASTFEIPADYTIQEQKAPKKK